MPRQHALDDYLAVIAVTNAPERLWTQRDLLGAQGSLGCPLCLLGSFGNGGLSPSGGDWKFRMKASAGVGPVLCASFPQPRLAILHVSSHCVSVSICISLLYKGHQLYWIRANPNELILT